MSGGASRPARAESGYRRAMRAFGARVARPSLAESRLNLQAEIEAAVVADYPVVGDYIALNPPVVEKPQPISPQAPQSRFATIMDEIEGKTP